MANTNAVKARFEDIRIFDSANLNGDGVTYVASTTMPAISNPVRLLKVSNNSDRDIIISFMGDAYTPAVVGPPVVYAVNPGKIYVAANGFTLYDVATNKCGKGDILELQAGDRFYFRMASAGAAGTGLIFIEIMYAAEQ